MARECNDSDSVGAPGRASDRPDGLREASIHEFVARLAHDINNPLNAMLGFTEFVFDEKPGPLNARQKEYLGDVLTSGRELQRLLGAMVKLSQAAAESAAPGTQGPNLVRLLEEAGRL